MEAERPPGRDRGLQRADRDADVRQAQDPAHGVLRVMPTASSTSRSRRLSSIVAQEQPDGGSERDPIPAEGLEPVAREVAEEGADGERRYYRRGEEPDQERPRPERAVEQGVAAPDEVEQRGRAERGKGEQ